MARRLCLDGTCRPEQWIKPPDAVNAPLLIEIDYTTTDDDYVDRECRDCGKLNGKHLVDCAGIIREWLKIAEAIQ